MKFIFFLLFYFLGAVYSQEVFTECTVELIIEDNCLREWIEPDIANLSGKDVRKHTFRSGKYKLQIGHPVNLENDNRTLFLLNRSSEIGAPKTSTNLKSIAIDFSLSLIF